MHTANNHLDIPKIDTAMPTRDAAQELLRCGFHPFPADHPDQPNCVGLHGPASPCDGKRGKHPAVAFGTWAVTVTDKMIDLAWKKHRGQANIAIACGPSGLVVLDDDGDLDKWAVTHGVTLPDTYTVTTGRGRHLYYRWDHTQRKISNPYIKNFALDIRGDGGYVIAEGSQHASGAVYTGNGLPVIDLPAEVAEAITSYEQRKSAPAGEPVWEHITDPGAGDDANTARIGYHNRHQALVSYAGRLRKLGLDYIEALPVFRQRWLLCVQPEGQIPEAKYHSSDCPEHHSPDCVDAITWPQAKAQLRDVYQRYAAGQLPDDDGGVPKLAAWCLTRKELADLPEPEPLIDNVLDKSSVALLYGKWGSGKSFIAVDWAACVATGKAWQGRPVEQQRVLYLAAEGAHGMKIRTDSWETGWHTQIPDNQFTVLRRAINLTNYAEVRALADLIEWGGYGLVVIDTLARCMVGADENSAKDCGQVVDALGRLLDSTPDGRGSVVGVHHTGKDGRTFRGSSVFEAGADTVYSVLAEGRAINLNREKRKDGPITDMHTLQIEPVETTKSCILSLHLGVEKPQRAQALLSTFLHHFSTTGATKTELRVVSDLSEGTFYRALSDLLQSGDLVNEGTEKRPFYKVVVR